MNQYFKLGKMIYTNKSFSDYRRMLVFIARSFTHNNQMNQLFSFFQESTMRRDVVAAHPYIFEQATRSIFYHKSNFIERLNLIKEHCIFLENKLTREALRDIYLGNGVTIWETEYQDKLLSMELTFLGEHRKEGLIAVVLKLDSKMVYQVIFWIARDSSGKPAIWIGALQGSLGGLQINRKLTKHFFGYRPQNLMLLAIRTIACQLSINRLYAVSNYGYYANNHIRIDRKLKVSLDDFWSETGGRMSTDPRFFELPIIEPRKGLEEVVSHKRNLYRKRFAVIDSVEAEIEKACKMQILKIKENVNHSLVNF